MTFGMDGTFVVTSISTKENRFRVLYSESVPKLSIIADANQSVKVGDKIKYTRFGLYVGLLVEVIEEE